MRRFSCLPGADLRLSLVMNPWFPTKTVGLLVLAVVGLLAARPARAATTVACVGDSITQLSGWPERLGTKLGAGYSSVNYGITTTTLLKKGDSPYWNTAAFTQSHQSNPNIVVIMLGTNDSKAKNWDRHKGEFVADYEALIDTYAALPSHPRIFLNLCPPAGTNGFGISGPVIENEILPLIRQVAATKGVGLIDVFSAFGGHGFDPSLFGSAADQAHPNGAGGQRIADTVYAALKAAADDAGAADAPNGADAGDGGGAETGKVVAVMDMGSANGTADAGPPADAPAAPVGPSAAGSGGSTLDGAAAGAGATSVPAGSGASGCGCRMPGSDANASASSGLALVALALIGCHRYRRRRAARPVGVASAGVPEVDEPVWFRYVETDGKVS